MNVHLESAIDHLQERADDEDNDVTAAHYQVECDAVRSIAAELEQYREIADKDPNKVRRRSNDF